MINLSLNKKMKKNKSKTKLKAKPKPKPSLKNINSVIQPETYKKFKLFCIVHNKTVPEALDLILNYGIDKYNKKMLIPYL